jgi:large subunit ribosomal protein L15
MKLHDLKPAAGSKKNRKRLGRGLGSGQGTYAGRGRKGQHARSGGVKGPYFEGGNLPLVRKLPFMRGVGFTSRNKIHYAAVNVADLARIETSETITPAMLAEVGLLRSPEEPVVILAHGAVERAIKVQAHRCSKAAREKIEAAGGSIELLS